MVNSRITHRNCLVIIFIAVLAALMIIYNHWNSDKPTFIVDHSEIPSP
ncbi:hypothetical protein [Pedobacter gandavensis]|uniref:Uncharacterized protein n=1 Tax=Pedobacter gandavensis TaxID=2679963 RepID=A0ABR6EU52_9SPHI|nr:hypothetical protein [Pedobacter gandavensis]MBB2148803.1 hypothetical protein [Pedobacter gandavensis]